MSKKVIVVGMIYKSPLYLDFMVNGIKKYCLNSDKYDVDYLIIANDANEIILEKLKNDEINHIIYNDNSPNDYYINRIYRAWNFGGFNAEGDIIVFINSDMAFSNNWLENLLSYLGSKFSYIPCSKLIESGKLPSGENAISKDFGKSPNEYNEESFLKYVDSIKIEAYINGGLFMPCAFYKKDFIKSGGYPEGNIYDGGPGQINTRFQCSGDHYFFYQNPVIKEKNHITVLDSIVYHIQEGELHE